MPFHAFSRREVLLAGTGLLSPVRRLSASQAQRSRTLRLTSVDLLPVRATERTVWLIVRLETDGGLAGFGEASDAFGFANTTDENALTMKRELVRFFSLIDGSSPFDIEAYRQRGMAMAREGLVSATAFSAIEQAMWDLAGKALGVPTCVLFGGAVRDVLRVYANINRATQPRTPEGFASAASRAVADGFRAIKAAPFDGFPPPGSPDGRIAEAVDAGIAAVVAIRDAVGEETDLMIDCHSFFDVDLAESVARRLEPQKLTWYEEPVPPENIPGSLEIGRRISQPMAGGELMFGLTGFAPLIREHVFDVIMPDVKHCGGLLEMTRIAAAADSEGVLVAPHNPSGPVATAAAIQICAGMRNFHFLEFQYGEADWRSEVLVPRERFTEGTIAVPGRPGFGITLDEDVIRSRAMPL